MYDHNTYIIIIIIIIYYYLYIVYIYYVYAWIIQYSIINRLAIMENGDII